LGFKKVEIDIEPFYAPKGQIFGKKVDLENFCIVYRHEIVFVNLMRKPDWLFERNPLGLVPILEYKGKVVYESAVCDEFLEDTFPASVTGTHALLPPNPNKRAAVRSLLTKFDTVS